MPRLVVVLPLVPLAQGDAWALNDWPLHVTVAPTFETGSAPAEIGEVLDSLLTQHPEIRVLADQDAGFGRAQDIPVTVLSPSPALDHLHRALIAGLTAVPVAFDDPDFIGDGYRAHVTKTRHAAAMPGELLKLSQVALVDMAPLGDARLRGVVWARLLAG